jgi:hypothetical protein
MDRPGRRGAVGARCPAVKRECPAPATVQVHTAQPFALDGLPGTTPAGHPPWSGGGRAFGACCFAGRLRSPAPPTGRPTQPAQLQSLNPYVNGYVNPYVIPYALGVRTPVLGDRGYLCSSSPLRGPVGRKNRGRLAPLGGVVRPRRAVRFARLIHAARPRSWPAFGRRRLSEPGLVATQRGRQDQAPQVHRAGSGPLVGAGWVLRCVAGPRWPQPLLPAVAAAATATPSSAASSGRPRPAARR